MNNIRNFCIIAHVDHGKSTLCDRLLEKTGTVDPRLMTKQFLDVNPISRERGITIKLAPVRMRYEFPLKTTEKKSFILNLIDTPGHVDFAYEVSRSLAACEGAVLLVDALAGVQAQTMSVFKQARDLGLKMIPVVNKIDLPGANAEDVALDMVDLFGFAQEEILFISAKTGLGVDGLIKEILFRIPPPVGKQEAPLRALVFDSYYDSYLGVVANVRIVDGVLNKEKLTLVSGGSQFQPVDLGFFTPAMQPVLRLDCGDVGYVATGLKSVDQVRVGDTITKLKSNNKKLRISPLPGYKEPKPMVFLGLYPIDSNEYPNLKEALGKLNINDASFSFVAEFSKALGKGFRCGFSGLLHAEIIQERLEREFNIDLIASAPSVVYEYEQDHKRIKIQTASQLPDGIKDIFEPWVKIDIFTPKDYLGTVMELVDKRRGKMRALDYLSGGVRLSYLMPLAELITDFFNRLKSASSGFASLDYEMIGYKKVKAVRLDILIHKEKIDALSQVVVKQKAYYIGKEVVKKLKEVLPKQQFEISIQAAADGQILVAEVLKAFRKDVTAKLYGGDRTRKDKLLKKQKKGKKRMKQFGKVDIPQEAFLAILKRN